MDLTPFFIGILTGGISTAIICFCMEVKKTFKIHKHKIEDLEQKLRDMEEIVEEFRRCSVYLSNGDCPVQEKKRKRYKKHSSFIIHHS